jgi:hypothetical protein
LVLKSTQDARPDTLCVAFPRQKRNTHYKLIAPWLKNIRNCTKHNLFGSSKAGLVSGDAKTALENTEICCAFKGKKWIHRLEEFNLSHVMDLNEVETRLKVDKVRSHRFGHFLSLPHP